MELKVGRHLPRYLGKSLLPFGSRSQRPSDKSDRRRAIRDKDKRIVG